MRQPTQKVSLKKVRYTYHLGIIDYLQDWNLSKKSEWCLKSIQADSKGISSVNPLTYQTRFMNFITSEVLKYDHHLNRINHSILSLNQTYDSLMNSLGSPQQRKNSINIDSLVQNVDKNNVNRKSTIN